MKAPSKFKITLTGTTIDIVQRVNAGGNIGHYLASLLCGQTLPDDIFNAWHLGVAIEEAPDLREPMSIFTVARAEGYVQITCDHCGRTAIYAAGPIAEMARSPRVQSDLRDLGRQLRCYPDRGGCGRRGATVRPVRYAKATEVEDGKAALITRQSRTAP